MSRAEEIKNIENEKRKGLIIAISDYGDNLPTLEYCKNDGDAIYEILKSQGYHILDDHKLIGQVKFGSMREAVITFFTGPSVKPHDTLLCCVI